MHFLKSCFFGGDVNDIIPKMIKYYKQNSK